MKQTALALVAALLLLLVAGCSQQTPATGGEDQSQTEQISGESSPQQESQDDAGESQQVEEPSQPDEPKEEPEVTDPLNGLILNQYPELEMTADMLIRRAVLPGTNIPLTVIISNNGDKSVLYTQGSGSYTTPQALITQFADLQPVLPKDHLGLATMDYATKELKPGESLRFEVNVMAIQPNKEFDHYTYTLYNDEQSYIAELEWPEIQQKYPDLIAAEPGPHSGTVSFRYLVVEGDSNVNPFGEPSGYAQAQVDLSVN